MRCDAIVNFNGFTKFMRVMNRLNPQNEATRLQQGSIARIKPRSALFDFQSS
jgi:hypothetical protein